MYRMAVRYRGTPLMPMRSNRVSRYIHENKGRIRYDRKLNIHYLQLLVEPSGYNTQDITIGLDPGSTYDGFSVVSLDTHHVNIELIQRPKKGKKSKNSVSTYKKRQSMNRRVRRGRLRHRRVRFDNRTSSKLPPTISANIEFRQWLITKLCKMYPITRVVVEDVRFNHYKKDTGSAFSLVEVGKQTLYKWIRDQGLDLEKYDGWNTKRLRINTFGGDPKSANKGDRSFHAHCVDSFVLACDKGYLFDLDTGEILEDEPVVLNYLVVNQSVIFIEKIVKVRRCLTRLRKRYKDRAFYYRLLPGGIKELIKEKYSSHRNLCRVKPPGIHAHHPPYWIYKDNEYALRFKCNTAPYGNKKPRFINGEWKNREIS